MKSVNLIVIFLGFSFTNCASASWLSNIIGDDAATEQSTNATEATEDATNLDQSENTTLGGVEYLGNGTEVTTTDSVQVFEKTTTDSNNCPWFLCNNTRCVLDTWRCDLQDDCGDNSDEDSCDQSTCDELDQFRCSSGMCISKDWICDWIKDCPHGDDEDNC